MLLNKNYYYYYYFEEFEWNNDEISVQLFSNDIFVQRIVKNSKSIWKIELWNLLTFFAAKLKMIVFSLNPN
jgi:hypothetical protein